MCVYSLFNDDVSSLNYTLLNGRMINELERTWKHAVMAQFRYNFFLRSFHFMLAISQLGHHSSTCPEGHWEEPIGTVCVITIT
jgi:hypothetical protein